MNTPARVGVVGCGVISRQYAEGARAFDSFELVACADLDRSQARSLAAEHDRLVASVDELIGDPSLDLVLNLTPPAAHAVQPRPRKHTSAAAQGLLCHCSACKSSSPSEETTNEIAKISHNPSVTSSGGPADQDAL